MNIKATGKTRTEIVKRFRQFEGSPKERRVLVDVVAAEYDISDALIYGILRAAGVAAEWRQERSAVPKHIVAHPVPPSLSALITTSRKATMNADDWAPVLDARIRNHNALLADLRS